MGVGRSGGAGGGEGCGSGIGGGVVLTDVEEVEEDQCGMR